jgi:DNA polymerase III subunit gamma/tau
MPSKVPAPPTASDEPAGYTVIARRYRPQTFEDVVGQDHVVQSLRNAIRLNRVTHAYLFAGTRGVGKTSIARIFAKCLNCVKGPTETPCNVCDICQAISVGQDVDVIEIDGASNNGVEAVRELRQNAGLRPSRARFKIYYIDEVHMLSTGAFNALLKTLEEPPEHVKFFFATTEPNKIPITVLSRCQRYDFAGITPEQVVETLTEICRREGVKAEPDALRTVARRASGSMRDAQSLLEQLLSAGGESLTTELVHQRLGTASDERLLDLVDALADHDSAAALRQVEQAANEGVQPTDLLNGLLEFLRDLMVMSAGADSLMLAATPRQKPRLEKVVARWPQDTIISALQILAEARARLRGSPHGRLIVELALARVARLENMRDLGEIIARLAVLESGSGPGSSSSGDVKKKSPAPEPPVTAAPAARPPAQPVSQEAPSAAAPKSPAAPLAPLTIEMIHEVWPRFASKLGLGLGVHLMPYADRLSAYLAISGPDLLAIRVPAGYNLVAEKCGTPDAMAKIEHTLQVLLRRPIKVRFDLCETEAAPGAPVIGSPAPRPSDELLETDTMVRKVVELFEAKRLHTEYDDEASPPSNGR